MSPFDREIAETVLRLGLFIDGGLGNLKRYIAEEQVTVVAQFMNDSLELSLQPSIGVWEHHMGKRIAGGVYFEIAAKYAEKVGGEIVQHANILQCQDGGGSDHLLASYPSMPLQWAKVCPGFRAVILGES